MARQQGIIRFTGTIDGLTYYNSKYGPLVRKKGGPTAEQMKEDPAFKRVRENGKEFGECGKVTKLIRSVLRQMLTESSDFLVTSRLNKLMFAIKNLDSISARGERNVAVGILSPRARDLIKGFDFNEGAPLRRILEKPMTANTSTGVMGIPGLIPYQDIDWPTGATHVKMTGGWMKIDFGTGMAELVLTNKAVIPKNGAGNNIVLTPNSTPSGTGNDFFLIQLLFSQETNGIHYGLKNGEFNAMGIVGVA
jgi:hypothetical protein